MAQTALRARRWLGVRAAWQAAALALVTALAGILASSALATVRIVSQTKTGTNYYSKIQSAVNATHEGDWVLIEPGVYDEPVTVTSEHHDIWIRGMNRNSVVIDGQHKAGNGVEVNQTNNVWVENLTVRNFDTDENGEPCPAPDGCGNDIWWNGGAKTSTVNAEGWYGAYLTAYNTDLFGGYGIFTGHETRGSWNNIYASGFNDSGMYLGACQECNATIRRATMENNSLGYSGSNSGGKLIIESSVFRNNSSGIVPNSEGPGDAPPPQDGECGRENNLPSPNPYPEITSTNIERCTIFRNNLITHNNNKTVPANASTARGAFGNGIILASTYADLIEHNVITNNESTGLFGIEIAPPEEPELFVQLAGNRISSNVFSHNGYHGGKFTGDITLGSGYVELATLGALESQSVNNCVSNNVLVDATFPAKIQETWGCQNTTTPNPGGAPEIYEYIEQAGIKAFEERKPVGQPVPPAQPTMPNPCKGVPTNPLCPK